MHNINWLKYIDLLVPRFNTNYGKNAIAHRGPILWKNAIIAQDKDFADTNYTEDLTENPLDRYYQGVNF